MYVCMCYRVPGLDKTSLYYTCAVTRPGYRRTTCRYKYAAKSYRTTTFATLSCLYIATSTSKIKRAPTAPPYRTTLIPNLPHHIESTGLETFSSLSPSRGAYRTKIVAIVQKINSPRLVSLRVSST